MTTDPNGLSAQGAPGVQTQADTASDGRPLTAEEGADVAGGFPINPKVFPEAQRAPIMRLNGWDADHGKKK
ncbi:hypothetical protein J5J86_07885 [Aquabacter sp. L1I39]|uniref:hypothetical protein n=1 Tax=Aquabacter sp. L1I39 TaxID=2820278 RepID=UPI001ADB95B8|nr:hypothetical protein [Aquabacter sp. L1I39]QTL05199.1 hypothetical protein J5J86_07885 [Aquabacter sp. L1I39]